MIPFDFTYVKPTSIKEAVDTYQNETSQGKTAMYISGGTEFITRARVNQVYADVVIDLKGIADCRRLGRDGDRLILGSAVTLNEIEQSPEFPLLSKTVRQIADHTSRNKITLGGNVASNLIYREGVLPLLVSDCQVRIAGKDGERTLPIKEVFHQEMKLAAGEFVVQMIVDPALGTVPHFHLKKTKQLRVDYPVVSLAALKKDGQLRIAFSGVCAFPFRADAVEQALNDTKSTVEERIDTALTRLPSTIIDDLQASAGYREFALRRALHEAIEAMERAIS